MNLRGVTERLPAAPPSFVDFVRSLGVKLTPAQRTIALVAFDGAEPIELSADGQALALEMFGSLDGVKDGARDVFVAVCGARGGKSYVFAALRILHLALTVDLSALAPGEVASAPVIAPDKDLAGQVLRYVKGAVDGSPLLRERVRQDTTETLELERDGRLVEIVCRAASARGTTGRGRSLVGAVLDEAAFFRDATFKVNDEEIYRAITPRVLPGGQVLVVTTPFAQSGLAYTLFAENHPEPSRAGIGARPVCKGHALAVHAPTLRLLDTPRNRQVVARELERDPQNAERENGAKFLSSSIATFFDAASIDAAIDPDLVMPLLPEPGDEVQSGADMGFSRNSAALAVTHRRGAHVTLAELLELKPQPGAPLKPSATVREMAERVVAHGGTMVMGDGHYRETVIEHLGEYCLGFLDAPPQVDLPFVTTRMALREGRLRIPNHPRLIRQLREVMSRASAGGKVTIILPKWRTGEHGDLVSAFVLAVWQSAGELVEAPAPEPGSQEAYAAAAKEAMKRRGEDVRRAQDPSVHWSLRGRRG